MPDIIHLLTEAVANQIAAGEVIQRPASVVKELMENAVDAGATSITVQVKDAGKTMIQVIDNGSGMSESDARLCFERHATSKIATADDLFAIRTMGFRGEALASIAAIAEVLLKTRRREDEVGTEINIQASRVISQEPVSTPSGTNFQVRNLFYNLPARRKFLKSEQTELRHIINEFNHVALTHGDIECILIHNHTEIFRLKAGNLRQRILGVFGKSANQYLIPLETETSIVRISGFIGLPEYARKTYGEQFFFVNNRFMKHPYFHKAVLNAYEHILAPEHIPSYFIFFETDPSRIDVNIHPTKTEIKFEDERSIWQILRSTVKEAIGKHNLSPSLDFDKEGVIDIPVLKKDTEIRIPGVERDPGYNPFQDERSVPSGNFDYIPQKERHQNWEKLFEDHRSPEERKDGPVPDHAMDRESRNKYLQIKNKYILSSVKSGLMVIDQRRAHERILYERLMTAQQQRKPVAQQTLFPETIELNPADYQVFLEIRNKFEEVGFDIRELGHHHLVVHGIPAMMIHGRTRDQIELMIEQYKNLQSDLRLEESERLIRSAASVSAIHSGKSLTEVEMQELVDQLFACSNPNYTPSGQLITTIIRLEELEEIFVNK